MVEVFGTSASGPAVPCQTTTAVPVSGFETDLRLTREARTRTLEQIQQETRIPIHVLKRFEEGDLVTDQTFNRIYLIAFLRSYGRAIGLPQADVVAAYERSVAGTYRGELHPDYDGPPPAPVAPPPSEPSAEAPDAPAPALPANAPRRTPKAPTPPQPELRVDPKPEADSAAADTPSAPVSPVEALRAAPVVSTSAPAAAAMRVARPSVPGSRRSYDKNWGAILSLFAVVIVAIAVAVYFLFFRTPDAASTDDLADSAGVATQIDSAGVGAGAASGGRQLQLPIEVRVTAQNNGLQSFRVSEDADGRRPYWLNVGESQTFTADSALVFSGEGSTAAFSDATLEWQGLRWTPADGQQVAITAATGQRMLDSLSAALGTATPAAPTPAP